MVSSRSVLRLKLACSSAAVVSVMALLSMPASAKNDIWQLIACDGANVEVITLPPEQKEFGFAKNGHALALSPGEKGRAGARLNMYGPEFHMNMFDNINFDMKGAETNVDNIRVLVCVRERDGHKSIRQPTFAKLASLKQKDGWRSYSIDFGNLFASRNSIVVDHITFVVNGSQKHERVLIGDTVLRTTRGTSQPADIDTKPIDCSIIGVCD